MEVLTSKPKLSFEDRQKANDMIEAITDDPETAAFSIVSLTRREAELVKALKYAIAEAHNADIEMALYNIINLARAALKEPT